MDKQVFTLLLIILFLTSSVKAQYSIGKSETPIAQHISFSNIFTCNVTVDAGSDTLICDEDLPIQLDGSFVGNSVNYFWSPSANLSDSSILNPLANAPGTYTLTVETIDDVNLVVNGDFENGDVGFTTDYSTGAANVGNYLISDTPQNYFNLFSDCDDHTSGTGNMMIVDGSNIPNENMWCQVINVDPNTDYYFSLWATMVGGTNPPELFFTVDGNVISDTTTIPLDNCLWTEVSQIWNSGTNTSIEFCIINNNISPFGNDFAIDDILVSSICEVTDEMVISVLEAEAIVSDSSLLCLDDCIILDASTSTTGTTVSYEWTSITGGIIQDDNTLTPTICDTGTYQLKVINFDAATNLTCLDSTIITIDLITPNPLIPIFTGLEIVCEGDSTSYEISLPDPNTTSYDWFVTGGTILNGQDSTVVEVEWSGISTGEICVAAINSCSTSDTTCLSLLINSLPPEPIISGPTNICNNTITNYSIPASNNILTYNWTIPTGTTIQSGEGTEMIELNWGTVQGGDICLVVENDCGADSSCLSVVFGSIQINIDSLNPLCSTDNNGWIKVTPQAGTAPFSFLWGNGEMTDSIGSLPAGTYQVTVSDDDGCSTEETIILQDPAPLNLTFSNTEITCHGECDGIIAAEITGGTAPYDFLWGNNLGTNDSLLNVCDGIYNITITDANGCTVEGQTQLNEPPLITAIISNDTIICQGEDANITFQFLGIGPYDVDLSDGSTHTNLVNGEVISISPIATTTISITNLVDQGQPNCSASSASSILITVNNPPDIPIISGSDSTCQNTTLNYCMTNVAMVDSFHWTIPMGATFTGQDSDCIEIDWGNSAGGQVCIEAINDCGSTQECIDVTVFPIPTSNFSISNPVICIDSIATIIYNGTASTTAIYTWNFDGGNIISGNDAGPFEINWSTAGIYNITLTVEENGCISTQTTENIIVENPIPSPVINCTSTTSSVTFSWDDVNGATSYLVNDLSGNGGMIIGNSYMVSGLGNGEQVTIEVTAMGNNACGPTTVQASCTADNCPTITVAIDHIDPICLTSNTPAFNFTATTSGGNNMGNMTWIGDGIIDATTGLFDPNIAGVGVHDITLSYEESNCLYLDVLTIQIFETPTSDFSIDDLICVTDNATITYLGTGSSNASYVWFFDSGTIISGNGAGPYEINWTTTGNYNITLTVEENGCQSDVFSQSIQVDPTLDLPIVTCESTTQSVTFSWVDVPNATGYLVTEISGPSGIQNGNTYEVTGMTTGEEVVIEVTAVGVTTCGNSTVQASCTADDCPTINVEIEEVPAFCLTQNMPQINLIPNITGSDNSGIGEWSGDGIVDTNLGVFDPNIAGPGSHNITFTFEEVGCTFTDFITIEIFDIPTADFSIDANICVTENATITYLGAASSSASFVWVFDGGTIVSGNGAGPYEVNWATAGDYNITLTVEENGCQSTLFSQNIQVDPILDLPIVTCESTTQSVTFSWADVPNATSYSITEISGPSGIQNGNNYEVTGMTTGEEVVIEVTAIGSTICGNMTTQVSCTADNCPTINVEIEEVTAFCLTQNAPQINLISNITGSDNSGIGEWSGNGIVDTNLGVFDPNIAGVGIHNITFTFEEVGCTYSDFITIEIFEIPTADFSIDANICITENAMVNYLGSANSSANYSWDFDGGIIVNGNGAGPFEINWPDSGTYNITLTVEENNCQSTLFSQNIQIDEVLATPNITCESTTNSITFSWDEITGATDYLINEVSGFTGVQNGNSIVYNNLIPGQEISLEITAIGNTICGNTISTETCFANNCPNIDLAITPIDDICLSGLTTEMALQITVNGSDGSGSGSWSGNGIVGDFFDPNLAGEGQHELTYSFSELQCDFSESIFVNVLLQPHAVASDDGHLDCLTTSINLSGSNSIVFGNITWTTDNGNIVNGFNGLTPEVDEPGVYFLTIENSGCTSIDSVIVTQNITNPIADAGTLKELTCNQTGVTLGGINTSQGDNFIYSWNSTNGFISSEMSPEVCEAGEYILTVLDTINNCISATSSVTVLENNTPPISQIESIGNLDCNNTSLVLDGSNSSIGNEIEYQWLDSNGEILGVNNSSFEATEQGFYYLEIFNNLTGCFSFDSIFINDITAYPNAEIITPEILTCDLLEVVLDGSNSSSSASIIYNWTTTTNSGILSGENTNQATVTQPGFYEIIVLDTLNGCETTASITVLQNIIPPNADAGLDIELECNETEAMLGSENTSSGINFEYLWTSSNPNVTITSPTDLNPMVDGLGTYNLLVTNIENGCTAMDEMEVSQSPNIPQNINLDIQESPCYGDDQGMIMIPSIDGGMPPYLYSLNGDPFSNSNIFNNLSVGEYEISIQDVNGCELSTSISISQPDSLSINLGGNITLELGDSVMLDPDMTGVFDTIIWTSNSNYSNCDSLGNCYNPIVAPTQTTNMVATIMNDDGCIAMDQMTIFVEKNRYVYIPNAFAPNGHIDNQIFMIYAGKGVEKVNTFKIFSRWGEQLFEAKDFYPNDNSYGWDGSFKGKKMNSGVYVYFAEIEFSDGLKIIYKGDVTLTW